MMERSATAIILGAELRAWRNRLLKRGRARLAVIVFLLFAATLTVGGSLFSVGAVSGHFLPQTRDILLAGAYTAFGVLMLVVGFPTVISALFVGRDLLQLVVAPVRPFEILFARALVAMAANLFISGILLAGVTGIGAGSGAPPAFYLLAPALAFVQALSITSVQAILITFVVRFVPARLARDVAAAVAGGTGAIFYVVWNVSLRQTLTAGSASVGGLRTALPVVGWLPLAWPGRALADLIGGDAGGALVMSGLVLALALVLGAVASVLYSRVLLTGVGTFGTVAPKWRSAPSRPATRTAKATGAASPVYAIARKDWLAYRRDVRRLSRLLPAILFPIGYSFAFLRPSTGGGGYWSEVFLLAFITMFMSTALATPSIPTERRGFQLLRMSPLSMAQLIRAKIALTLPPVAVLAIVFCLVLSFVRGGPPGQTLGLAVLVIWLAFGFVAIGVSTGAIDPRFDAADDRRSVGLLGSLAGVGAALGFGILSVAAFALLRLAWHAVADAVPFGPLPGTAGSAAALLVVAMLTAGGAAAVVTAMLLIANARLRRFEAPISAN